MSPDTKRERKQMAIRLRFCGLMLVLGVLAACGKKGPLYLPPDKMPVAKPVLETRAKPTAEPMAEPAISPEAEATDKPRPAATPADEPADRP